MKVISTEKAPAAIGPYSQGIVAGDFFFASGQIAIIPETGEIAEATIEAQTEQVMKNIGNLLAAAGADYSKVVKTSCFLADMGDFGAFNEIYAKYSSNISKSMLSSKASSHICSDKTMCVSGRSLLIKPSTIPRFDNVYSS